MCLMTEKQASYTDGEIEEENMLTEVFNESDRLYSPFTVGKENKSTVTDNILLSDIGGYPDQQNKTVALQLQRIPTQFSSELPEDYSLLNKWKQVRDVEHMSDLENWKSERNNEKSTNKDPIDRLRDELIMERKILINMVQAAHEREISRIMILKAALVILEQEIRKGLLKAALVILKQEIRKSLLKDAYEREIGERLWKENEKKEYIRQLFVMLLLIILIKNIGENIKCRQTSCRKYPCLNSILYLLWQSGDVEVNPGPANSTTYRKWLYEICSIVRKAIAGVTTECKMTNIWKKKPENWPQGEPYFDPRNSKGLAVNKVEDFLRILIRYCDTNNLSKEIKSEIDTWNNSHRSKDNGELLHLCRKRECRKLIEQVNRSLKVFQNHLLPDEIQTVEVNPCIRISLSCQPAIHKQLITNTIYRAEATRKIASFLGRILHGKDPDKKCDHIWTTKPDGWPSNLRYYNPNNGGERCAQNEDGMIVEALITLCRNHSIILPKTYQDLVNAWQDADQTLLSKLMTRHTSETDLKKAFMKLHEEGLLQDPEVNKHLKELGLLVKCDGSTQNAKSQKRKIVNTMKKQETKRTKQSDYEFEDAVDTTLNEILPDWPNGQLLDNQSDPSLLDIIGQNIPDFLEVDDDDVKFH